MKNPAPILTGGCEPNAIMTRSYRGITPRVAPSAYVDPGAHLIGDVVVGAKSSIWPCAVLRGDSGLIEVGEETSIQDGTVLHCDSFALLRRIVDDNAKQIPQPGRFSRASETQRCRWRCA